VRNPKTNDIGVNGEVIESMLSKCANPACSATFRYLGEGKLYLIDSKDLARHRAPAGSKYAGKSCTYLWLCSSCCQHMTIQIDSDLEVQVARKRGIQSDSEPDIPAASATL
jgi:hypothetical protein